MIRAVPGSSCPADIIWRWSDLTLAEQKPARRQVGITMCHAALPEN
jgi:hypothetical protein